MSDDDRFLIAEARRVGPVLRGRISDTERLAGEPVERLADLAERLADAQQAADHHAAEESAAAAQEVPL